MTNNTNNENSNTDSDRRQIRRCVSCLRCKGICHEGSLKKRIPEGYGARSHYFCSYNCMKLYNELKYYSEYKSIMNRHGNLDEYEQKMEEMAQEQMKKYEYVDMITE